MIEIGITKKQHYVSQGILKHFADQQKKIYELFIDKSIVTKKSIVDTMSQNYVYEHSKIEKNSIEDLFAKFESKAFPLIDSLITEIEEYCRDGDNIIPFKDKIDSIIPYVLLFYFRSGALLREYSMDAENPKEVRVERMLLNIMDVGYIRGLRNTICNCYKCAIICDEEEKLLLSDQYVSTVALKYKNRFSNASNRQIGMKDTMILIPLSSKFYIVFFYGRCPVYIKENKFVKLDEKEVQEINDVIYQNSYVKCVGKTEDELERVKNVHFETFSPTKCIMKYSDGSIQDRIIKREVFFYEEDKDMNAHSFDYMSTYKTSIEGKIGRNDKCVCGSGKKYKKCCISKYEKAARILQDIYNQKNVDYTIPGARVVEDSILEYEGPQEKLKNKHDKDIIEKIIELSEKEEIRKNLSSNPYPFTTNFTTNR